MDTIHSAIPEAMVQPDRSEIMVSKVDHPERFSAITRKYIEAGKDQQGKGFDPRKLLAPGFEAIKATVKEKMELFGSVNKA